MPSPIALRRTLAAALASLALLPGAASARLDARHAAASDPEYGAAYREGAGGSPTLAMIRSDDEARLAAAQDPEYAGAYRARVEMPRALAAAEAASSAGAASDPENVAAYR
ncbi:MAG TPA: hypothetical protein VFP65_08535 [Anaeromyxobacteraceae bacterium]|nr:hypothetical protein [Anaeromyxobacteraceae bacterium]